MIDWRKCWPSNWQSLPSHICNLWSGWVIFLGWITYLWVYYSLSSCDFLWIHLLIRTKVMNRLPIKKTPPQNPTTPPSIAWNIIHVNDQHFFPNYDGILGSIVIVRRMLSLIFVSDALPESPCCPGLFLFWNWVSLLQCLLRRWIPWIWKQKKVDFSVKIFIREIREGEKKNPAGGR